MKKAWIALSIGLVSALSSLPSAQAGVCMFGMCLPVVESCTVQAHEKNSGREFKLNISVHAVNPELIYGRVTWNIDGKETEIDMGHAKKEYFIPVWRERSKRETMILDALQIKAGDVAGLEYYEFGTNLDWMYQTSLRVYKDRAGKVIGKLGRIGLVDYVCQL